MIDNYFKSLYNRTMTEAYALAINTIKEQLTSGGTCLDCGCGKGGMFDTINKSISLPREKYSGIEWHLGNVKEAQQKGLNVIQGDLNAPLPYNNDSFDCVFGLSLLEHLTNGCQWISEAKRVLKQNGSLVILTPNISTLFTIALLAMGKMPSSGPHPDSEILLRHETSIRVSAIGKPEITGSTPQHRHMVVFSFRVLRSFLRLAGFRDIRGYAFGLYPFPNFMQPILEKIDPFHCHQMVFIAKK